MRVDGRADALEDGRSFFALVGNEGVGDGDAVGEGDEAGEEVTGVGVVGVVDLERDVGAGVVDGGDEFGCR